MKIQLLGIASLLIGFLCISGSASAEGRNELLDQTDQLYEALSKASHSTEKLDVLAQGMSDEIRHLLLNQHPARYLENLESIRSAQSRVAVLDRVANYLDRAYSSADRFVAALHIYHFVRNRSDKERIAPILARMRDQQAERMEKTLRFIEQKIMPDLTSVATSDMVYAAIQDYRKIRQLMISMQF